MKKKPKSQTRSEVKHMLRIRLSKGERKLLDEHAATLGVGTSTWARMELLSLAKQGKR